MFVYQIRRCPLLCRLCRLSDKNDFGRVASGLEKSGKFDIFSMSGNCQEILKIGQ